MKAVDLVLKVQTDLQLPQRASPDRCSGSIAFMSAGTISPDTIHELEAWADEECSRWAPVNTSFFDDFSHEANKLLSVYVFDLATGELRFAKSQSKLPLFGGVHKSTKRS